MERSTVASPPNMDLIEDYYDRWQQRPGFGGRSRGGSFLRAMSSAVGAGGPLATSVELAWPRGAGGRHPADRRLPRVRPLPGRPRSAQAHAAAAVARAAGAGGLRPLRGRPRPGLLQPSCGAGGRGTLRELIADPAQDVLPHDRRRVHAHPRHCEIRHWLLERMEPTRNRPRFDLKQEAADHLQAERRRAVRDVPPQELRGPEAVLARGRRDADSASGRDHRAGGGCGRARDRHGHAAPRPAQRAGQHPRQALRHDLQRVRGQHCPRRSPATATSSITSASRPTTSRPTSRRST